MDDFISYDEKQSVLLGKETKRKLMSGDQVRVRVTAVSLGRAGSSGKIGVTSRQPFLGKLEWIEKDIQKIKAATEKRLGEKAQSE
jgi:DNA-directed RNA polymerase subunit E'